MKSEPRTEIRIAVGPEREVVLTTEPGVFLPTGTTNLLIQTVQKSISGQVTLLDLGCGSGIVGLALYFQGRVKPPLYASDLSQSAVHCSRENLKRYGCLADVRCGPLLSPWEGEIFDVIVNDISGVSQDVAAVSPWFNGIPCNTGRDGTALVVDIIRNAPDHLAENGRFFFPVLSLSNVDLILKEAQKNYNIVERIARLEWPLPSELKTHMPLLKRLEEEGCIRLQKKFGMVLCYTEIYCACNS